MGGLQMNDDAQQLKNFSKPANNNRTFIVEKLARLFVEPGQVLEIGSGSGQHAVYFAHQLPHLHWQTSDQGEYLEGLQFNIDAVAPENVISPLALDVASSVWPVTGVDYVFGANTLHIMSESDVVEFFRGVGDVLIPGGTLVVYGPFKYAGKFTTESNAEFDLWLKQRNAESGIREIETIEWLAKANSLTLVEDHSMPANNQLLVFRHT